MRLFLWLWISAFAAHAGGWENLAKTTASAKGAQTTTEGDGHNLSDTELLDSKLASLQFTKEHALDLLRVCFSEKLDCKLLSKTIDGKTYVITLIGESHDQDLDTYNMGLNLVRHYPKFGYENGATNFIIERMPDFFMRLTDRYGSCLPCGTRKNYEHSLCKFRGAFSDGKKTKLMNVETGFRSKLPIYNASMKILLGSVLASSGVLLAGGDLVFDAYQGDGIDYASASKLLAGALSGIGYAMWTSGNKDLARFKKNINKYCDVISSEMRPRDEIMAKNLVAALKSKGGDSIVASMGRVHLYGVSKFLKAYGFTSHDSELMKQYRSIVESKNGAVLLEDTKFRDLTDIRSCSFRGLRAAMEAKQLYPEDFGSNI